MTVNRMTLHSCVKECSPADRAERPGFRVAHTRTAMFFASAVLSFGSYLGIRRVALLFFFPLLTCRAFLTNSIDTSIRATFSFNARLQNARSIFAKDRSRALDRFVITRVERRNAIPREIVTPRRLGPENALKTSLSHSARDKNGPGYYYDFNAADCRCKSRSLRGVSLAYRHRRSAR